MRKVDRAGVEIDEGHRDTLSPQRSKVVHVHTPGLDSIDEIRRVGTTESGSEVLWGKRSDVSLQKGANKQSLEVRAGGIDCPEKIPIFT